MAAELGAAVERSRPSLRELLDRWGVPLLVTGLALGTAWLLHDLGSEDRRRAGGAEAHRPDAWMERFESMTTDTAGTQRERLRAERMVHFADDGSSELAHPELEFYNEDPRPWRVRSETGWVSGDGTVVILSGPVTIWREAADGRREFELLTRDLRVLPEARYAETDAPVTIRHAGTETQAVGMRADLGVDKLELMKDVRSRYENQAR